MPAIVRLNVRCAQATAIAGSPVASICCVNCSTNGRKSSTPTALNRKLLIAAARATGCIEMLATSAVEVDPTLAPSTIGMADSAGSTPCCPSGSQDRRHAARLDHGGRTDPVAAEHGRLRHGEAVLEPRMRLQRLELRRDEPARRTPGRSRTQPSRQRLRERQCRQQRADDDEERADADQLERDEPRGRGRTTFAPSAMPRLPRKLMTPASARDAASDVIALLDCATAVATTPIRKPRQRLSVTRGSHDCSAAPPTGLTSRLKPWRPCRNSTMAGSGRG